MLVVIFIVFSCQKEVSTLITDPGSITAQMFATALITEGEVLNAKEAKGDNIQTKSANMEKPQVRIFALDKSFYKVENGFGYKYLSYYVVRNQNLIEYLTLVQIFPITDGVINPSNYALNYYKKFGACDRFYYLNEEDRNYVSQIFYHLRLSSGEQWGYYGNSNEILLAPIANAKWQVEVDYYNGQVNPTYMSNLIDLNSDSELRLTVKIQNENINAYFEMPKEMAVGASFIRLFGDNDQEVSYKIKYDESFPAIISFATTFDINRVTICYEEDGCVDYDTKPVRIVGDKTYFQIK